MSYELNNIRLVKILPDVITNTFIKREFIVATDEQYPQLIKFELHNDKVSLISGIFPGDTISISFNIRGREWINPEEKSIYFSSFVVWKIKKIENGYQVPTNENSPHIQHQFNFPPASEVFGNKISEYKNQQDEDYSDLPF